MELFDPRKIPFHSISLFHALAILSSSLKVVQKNLDPFSSNCASTYLTSRHLTYVSSEMNGKKLLKTNLFNLNQKQLLCFIDR